MTTRHLKKRDRDWARITIFRWKHGRGRGHSSCRISRFLHAEAAAEFIAHRDPFQQEALAIKP